MIGSAARVVASAALLQAPRLASPRQVSELATPAPSGTTRERSDAPFGPAIPVTEANAPNTNNHDTAMSADGCELWFASDRAIVEELYFTGRPAAGAVPAIRAALDGRDFLAGAGRVRSNTRMSANESWAPREWGLVPACGGSVCVDYLQQRPVAETVPVEYFTAGGGGAIGAQFRATFPGMVGKLLGEVPLFAIAPNQRAAVSLIDGANDYTPVLRANASLAAAALAAAPAGITAEHIGNRALAQSCAGGHDLADGRDLGGGVFAPQSLGGTHVTESGGLSQGLREVWLPARERAVRPSSRHEIDREAHSTMQLAVLGPTRGLPAAEDGHERVRKFRLSVVEGANNVAEWRSTGVTCSIGSHASNDLVLEDDTVSRFHCEISSTEQGFVLRDLASKNGTALDGVRIQSAFPRGNSTIRLGTTVLRFEFERTHNVIPVHPEPRFGRLLGTSVAMRSAFAVLARAAGSESTLLIEGETGTGKEHAARAVHAASARKAAPFVIVDCGAIPENLLESELFGHEKGAFTGADARRVGAFEEADGGTIFLDEIGEVPVALQPKLLRALETREVRRIGSNTHRTVDVRIVAATNRDLRARVNTGDFREDLFYRLCVVRVVIPPLREHPEDLAPLVAALLVDLDVAEDLARTLSAPEFLATLARHAWPGNVRELRNFIERCVVLEQPLPVATAASQGATARLVVDPTMSYADSRKLVLETFEREYAAAMYERHAGNVTLAAKAAGIGRVYFHRLLKKRGLK